MSKKINFIKLVVLDKEGNAKEGKNGDFEVETYFTPNFIPFRKIYEATDIMEGTSEDGNELTEKEMFKRMTDFVVDVYNKQFTSDDLLDRLHALMQLKRFNHKYNLLLKVKWMNKEKSN